MWRVYNNKLLSYLLANLNLSKFGALSCLYHYLSLTFAAVHYLPTSTSVNMLVSSTSFAMRVFISSFHGIRLVGQVLGYVLPRSMSSIRHKINYNTKHLTKGDPLPPFNGKPRLFNMRYCPFAHRAVLALNAKNIDYEVINVNLVEKPEWLLSKSNFTKVPALEVTEGVTIIESLVIAQYLDDVYPERRLLPKDPLTKAFDQIIVESVGQIQAALFKSVLAPDSVDDSVIAGYFRSLNLIQDHLQSRGTKFLDGDQPGYADYMIWPWFERLPNLADKRLKMDPSKYKVLLDYTNNMLEDPVVKDYALPKEYYQKFHESYALGKPAYDMLLKE